MIFLVFYETINSSCRKSKIKSNITKPKPQHMFYALQYSRRYGAAVQWINSETARKRANIQNERNRTTVHFRCKVI